MTVQQLIDELQKIENKSLEVKTTWRDSEDSILRVELSGDIVEIVPASMYPTDIPVLILPKP